MIPEPTEQEIISSLGYDRPLVSYTEEDDGLIARIDRDIRHEIERRNGNGKNKRPET